MDAGKTLLFQELEVGPTLTPGDQKQFHLCASGGLQASKMVSEPLSSRVRRPDAQDTDKDLGQERLGALIENAAVFKFK